MRHRRAQGNGKVEFPILAPGDTVLAGCGHVQHRGLLLAGMPHCRLALLHVELHACRDHLINQACLLKPLCEGTQLGCACAQSKAMQTLSLQRNNIIDG